MRTKSQITPHQITHSTLFSLHESPLSVVLNMSCQDLVFRASSRRPRSWSKYHRSYNIPLASTRSLTAGGNCLHTCTRFTDHISITIGVPAITTQTHSSTITLSRHLSKVCQHSLSSRGGVRILCEEVDPPGWFWGVRQLQVSGDRCKALHF